MATKICKAVLNLDPNDWDGINKQGEKFLDNLYVHPAEYPDPPITEEEFKAQVTTSKQDTVAAVEGSKHDRSNREAEGTKLYDMMSYKLIPYINTLYIGNRTKIELSGAKTSVDPTPVPRPDAPIIKKIIKGPEPNTVQIKLVRGINPELKRRSRIENRIFMFEKEDDAVGEEVGCSFNSNKLIGHNIPENVARYYLVIAYNTGGVSDPSDKVKFYLMQ